MTWTAPSTTGGSDVLDYTVYWDQGTGSFVELESGVAATSYTKAGLAPGTTYAFKVRARNALGDGAFSAAVSISLPAADRSASVQAPSWS